jgi:tagaturonate reductase
VDPDGRIRVVPDVRPYRERKVRLLNGPHTAMAALGVLSGIPTVHDAMRVPALSALLRALALHELAPLLDVPDAVPFAETVLQRFANPQVRHRLTDIATQGTLKWRVRLLPMLQRHAAVTPDTLPTRLVISLAAQLYLSHPLERARRAAAGVAPFADALGDEVHAHWLRHAGPGPMLPFVAEVLADRSIWGDELPAMFGLAEALAETLHRLHADGVRALLTPATVST